MVLRHDVAYVAPCKYCYSVNFLFVEGGGGGLLIMVCKIKFDCL